MSKIEERLRSVNAHVAPYANDLVRGWCHEGADVLKACEQALRAIELRVDGLTFKHKPETQAALDAIKAHARETLAKLEGAK
jgi:hypothetical protein